MQLVRFEPFNGVSNFRSLFSDLLDENFARPVAKPSASKWYPAVDILESKEAYVIRAELPGMKKEDIRVEINEGNLVLSGERKADKPAEGVEYRHVERVASKFWRSFALPETVKQDGIEASYKEGILEIHVPKAEEAKPRQIAITVQ